MKVLWLINAPFPAICEAAGLGIQVKEGWIDGLFKNMTAIIKEEKLDVALSIVFPQFAKKETIEGKLSDACFYGYFKEEDKPYKYNERVTERLKEIVDKVKPDVVHIAGTEYDHAYSMTKAFPYPERTIVSIQGMTSVYAKHYMADLPFSVVCGFTFRDLVKWDNLIQERKKYIKRGRMEIEVIKAAGHIVGRTDWDRISTKRLNPDAKYYHCGEILRKSFYDGTIWDYEKCEKHSIFVSQGYYPIKGLHYMLEALYDIRKFYPDVRLYVGGGVTLNNCGFKQRLKKKSYQRYLSKLINAYELSDNVIFLDALKEDEMRERYLKSNVFVSPSSIENSPNSVGEAMILGVPCVSSMVGGVASMLEHGREGYTYQHDAAYMLAGYCMDIFEACDKNHEKIELMTRNAKMKADKLFDRRLNAKTMLDIYMKGR